MKKFVRARPKAGTIIALGALVVALGGVAYAAIPDGTGVIHACYNKSNGRVRLTDTATNKPKGCNPKTETAITWSQTGPQGPPGPASPATYTGPHWGLITRNTIGSPVADLRSGPYGSIGVTGPTAVPPDGVGSLGIAVTDDSTANPPGSNSTRAEKVAFGNEVDFFGDEVLDINDVGFQVFQTGENADISPGNLPNITFEIDPNLNATASNFSSMVFNPDPVPSGELNQWSSYIDATTSGQWSLTGAAGTATGCNQTTTCSFAALKTALDDAGASDTPKVLSAAIAKGRDNEWVGAVDDFRINDTIYNFEPFGVEEIAAP